MTATFNEGDHPRDKDKKFTEKNQADPGNQVISAAAVGPHLETICTQAGLGSMTGMFDLIRDRETVTDHELCQLDAADVTRLYETHIGPAVDRVEDNLIAGEEGPDGIQYSSDTIDLHLDIVCTQAGLGSMKDIYDVVRDREIVRDQAFMVLNAEDVTYQYEEFLSPAIDDMETDLLGELGTDNTDKD